MNINEIASIATLLSTIIVGVILSSKIKTQSDLLNKYKDILGVIDIGKIKEFHELEKRAIVSKHSLEIDNFYKQTLSDVEHQFDEMASYITSQLLAIDSEVRKEIIRVHLPNCQVLFQDHFDRLAGKQKDG